MVYLSIVGVVLLVAVHTLGSRIKGLDLKPRSKTLSFAGGISVAYVFIHILPELSEHQESLTELPFLHFIEAHAYLISLLGLLIFYGLERAAKINRKKGNDYATGVFKIHIASFTIYNLLIGYGIVNMEEYSQGSMIFYIIAMALHFLINDVSLYDHYKELYKNKGRWILAGGIVTGWVAGFFIRLHEAAIAVVFAFIAGGIILNVLKEELPEERESSYLPFFTGAFIYAVLLIVI